MNLRGGIFLGGGADNWRRKALSVSLKMARGAVYQGSEASQVPAVQERVGEVTDLPTKACQGIYPRLSSVLKRHLGDLWQSVHENGLIHVHVMDYSGG